MGEEVTIRELSIQAGLLEDMTDMIGT